MTNTKPTTEVVRRDQGLALAEALLQSNRPLPPLPAAAHERVKRRLRNRLFSPRSRRARWLRPLVIAGSLLLWGTAFGIAIDRFVLEERSSPSPRVESAAAPHKPRAHGPKAKTGSTREIPVEDDQATPSETAVPDEVTAPTVEPVLPEPSKEMTTPPPLAKLSRPQTSRSLRPVERPAPASEFVAVKDPPTALSPPPATAVVEEQRSPATDSAVAVALLAPLPETPAPAPAPPTPALAPPPAAPRPPEKTATDGEGLTEERLLAAAVRALRAKRDAASALVALGAYRNHYPQGRLSIEASVLRVDALTALGRQIEALRTLDELDLSSMPGGLERRLQRSELRATSGRFREALADFDWVLSHAREPDSIERALGGRTLCRQRLGDLAGARSDAIEYLRRFPAGPFARQAKDIAQVSPKTDAP